METTVHVFKCTDSSTPIYVIINIYFLHSITISALPVAYMNGGVWGGGEKTKSKHVLILIVHTNISTQTLFNVWSFH